MGSETRHEQAEVTVALTALSSFQQVTAQADAKASMLLAIHVGVTALLTGRFASVPPSPALWLAGVIYAISFAVSGYLLIQVVRPRLGDVPASNPFALGRRTPRAIQAEPASAADAWQVAEAVAVIAATKNRFVALAIPAVASMVVSAVAWLLLAGRP